MPQRDPAADAHTIAALHISELAWFGAEEIEEQLGWMPGGVPDLTDTEITAIRAELKALADKLTLALGADVVWGFRDPASDAGKQLGGGGYQTRAAAERIAGMLPYPTETICRLVTPWQPAPTVPAGEVWDDSTPPGGYVCAVCGMPTESEPCPIHSITSTED